LKPIRPLHGDNSIPLHPKECSTPRIQYVIEYPYEMDHHEEEDRLDFVGLDIGQELVDAFRKLVSQKQWRLICFKNCTGRVNELLLESLERDKCQELWLTAAPEEVQGEEPEASSLTSIMRSLRDAMVRTQSLRCLYVSSILDLEQASLLSEGLRECSSLQVLDLTALQVVDSGAQMVAFGVQGNTSLESLRISDEDGKNTLLEESILRCLPNRSEPIKTVVITGPCSNSLFQALQEASPMIDRLTLLPGDMQQPLRFHELVDQRSRIRHLQLSRNQIRDDAAAAIFESLQNNQVLESLDLSYNQISDKGLRLLADALPNMKLKELRMEGNPFEGKNGSGLQLLEAVKNNTCIERLQMNLYECSTDVAHLVRLNIGGRKVLRDPTFKVSLLPFVFERINRQTFDLTSGSERLTAQADSIFHLLCHGPIFKEPEKQNRFRVQRKLE
jgi:hypothetical protein